MTKYTPGDLVQLKSGGALMTIIGPAYDGEPGEVICTWYEDDKEIRSIFRPELIEAAHDTKPEPCSDIERNDDNMRQLYVLRIYPKKFSWFLIQKEYRHAELDWAITRGCGCYCDQQQIVTSYHLIGNESLLPKIENTIQLFCKSASTEDTGLDYATEEL